MNLLAIIKAVLRSVLTRFFGGNLAVLLLVLLLPVGARAQFWELFATKRMITTDEGDFWPLRTFVPPSLPTGAGKIHTVEIYNQNKLVEKIEFDNKGRVRSKTKYLPENEWAGLEEKGFGTVNHYGYEEGRTIDSAIGQKGYNKELGIILPEPAVEYREINAGMKQLKELGASFFSYSKGLFLRMNSFYYYGGSPKEQVKDINPYTPIITYQGDPKQAIFCYGFPEVKEVDTEKFYEVLYPNERFGSPNYSFDLFGLFKTIRAESVLDSETIQKILGINIPLDSFLSSYFKGTESTNIRSYANRDAQISGVSSYRDTAHNLVAFQGTYKGTKVKGYNFLRDHGPRTKGIVEFEIPENSHKVNRLIFTMERNLNRRSGLYSWDIIAIPNWRIFIIGEGKNIIFVGNEFDEKRYAFIIPPTLTNGSQVKAYMWQEGTTIRKTYNGTPYAASVARLTKEATFTIKMH